MSQTIDLRNKDKAQAKQETAAQSPVIELVPEIVVREEKPVVSNEIVWSTHLSPPHQKGPVLFVTGALIILAGLVAYFSRDILFTTVLVLSAIVINLIARIPSKPSEVRVHATGISIDNSNHHFADMKSFWVDYQPNIKEIRIEMKKGYAQRLKIPLEDTDPVQIRRSLLTYMPEKEHELSLIDHIVRLIGF